jgi:hypothetical protein
MIDIKAWMDVFCNGSAVVLDAVENNAELTNQRQSTIVSCNTSID